MEYNPKIRFKFIENLWQARDYREAESPLKAIYYGKQAPHTFTELMFFKSLKSYQLLYESDKELTLELIQKVYELWSAEVLSHEAIVTLKTIIQKILKFRNEVMDIKRHFVKIFSLLIKQKIFPEYNVEMAKLLSNYMFVKDGKPPIIMYSYGTMKIVQFIEENATVENIYNALMLLLHRTQKFNEAHENISLDEIRKKLYGNMQILQENYGIQNLYIYGSYARGEQTKFSDIDLFAHLYEDKKMFANLKDEITMFMTKLFGIEVDIIVDDISYDKNLVPVDIFIEAIKVF